MKSWFNFNTEIIVWGWDHVHSTSKRRQERSRTGPGTVIKRSWTNRFLPARTACTVGLAVNGLPTFFLLDEKSKMKRLRSRSQKN